MTTEVTVHQPQPALSPSAQNFELAQRQAMALSKSGIIPDAYRNNIANCLVALELANRIGAAPMQVMQNLHIIQGRPSWSSSFLIATVNASNRFTPLRFEIVGDDPTADGYRVRAHAEDRASGEKCVGSWVTWAMVKAEGWDKKTGSKWKSMPEQMFLYRAAAFWTRVYAPEMSQGIHTADEVEDIIAAPQNLSTSPVAAIVNQGAQQAAIGRDEPQTMILTPHEARDVLEAEREAAVEAGAVDEATGEVGAAKVEDDVF